MIAWLENNPVGQVLAAFCGGMLVIILVLGLIWWLPPSGSGDGGDEDETVPSLDIPTLKAGEPIEKYNVIVERPVFSESRQPEIVLEMDDEELVEEIETEVEAPEVELAGVVITPSLRMVTLKQKDGDESLVAFEGRPLEGDYGSWQVHRIEPRAVTLRSGAGEEVELELQVHDAMIREPPKPPPEKSRQASEDEGGDEEDEGRQLSRAEEIRQRIAERREELRRAAEEGEAEDAKPADYRSAIQSLMTRKKEQTSDENEQ